MASNLEARLDGLREQARVLRRNVWRALHAAGSGHMGGSLSAADLLAALYFHYLRIRPEEPDWPGRDRFVLDVRPLVHRKLGVASSLACRPYDVVSWLVAAEVGCVVRDPFGIALDAPLDITTNVAFACYANETLAAHMIPIVREEVERHLGAV